MIHKIIAWSESCSQPVLGTFENNKKNLKKFLKKCNLKNNSKNSVAENIFSKDIFEKFKKLKVSLQ